MNKWFKRSAWMVGLFIGAMALLYTAAWAKTENALAQRYEIADAPLQFRGDAAEQARGEHLYTVLGCVECHAEGGVGRVVFDAGPVARVTAPNLTPAALADRYNADQLAAAIRHGGGLKLLHVGRRFRQLLVVTKLDGVLASFESEDAAVASFPSSEDDRREN